MIGKSKDVTINNAGTLGLRAIKCMRLSLININNIKTETRGSIH